MSAHVREFDYTQADFERARMRIRELAGIALSESKHDMVYSRLARRVRACSLHSLAEYLDYVDKDEAEREAFVNALTTNLTYFFREPHHFRILADFVADRGLPRDLRIWCAAASTGEEPYSIAITLAEAYGGIPPRVRVVASDIDTETLLHGQRGVYPLERLQSVAPALQRKYFLKGTGRNEGLARVRPELRAMLEFAQINLLGAQWPHREPFDVIFCRNVLIYFDKATQRSLLRRFHPALRSNGLLMTGHSESLLNSEALYELAGHTVYRRRASASGGQVA